MSPPIIGSKESEKAALLETAKHMAVSARTAPKTAGIDDILTLVVYGKEKEDIATKMEEIGEERKIEGFKRDAKNVIDSEAVVLVGVRGKKSIGLNCGACGYKNCKNLKKQPKSLVKTFLVPHACLRLWIWE